MRAMVLNALGLLRDNPTPLQLANLADPLPGEGEILIKVRPAASATPSSMRSRAGRPRRRCRSSSAIRSSGGSRRWARRTSAFRLGDRVGVAWIFSACGSCDFCRERRGEPLRPVPGDRPRRQRRLRRADGRARGVRLCHPRRLHRRGGRPLSARGAIGYRSLRLTGLKDGQSLGLTGFGASAHLVLKMVRHRYPHTRVFVFARTEAERAFARELGAAWAGDTAEPASREAALPSSTPRPPGLRSSRRSRTSSPAGGWSSTRSARRTRDKDALLGLDYPSSSLAREGDQERRQRHAGRRPRVPATGRRDPAQAGGPGIRPEGCQPGARRAEGRRRSGEPRS